MFRPQFKCYEPPVKLSEDELERLKELSFSHSLGVSSPLVSCGGDAAVAAPDVSLLGDDIISGSGLHPHLPIGAGPSANGSLALQALYKNNAVKDAFSDHQAIIIGADDDSDEDEDEIWEDNMDPITFARYYAAFDPVMARIVRDHDQAMRERLNQGIANWIEGVQSGYSEDGAS
jgi:hypothetical protein